MKNAILSLLLLPALTASAAAPKRRPAPTGIQKLSFVLTNDVHGHLESYKPKNGRENGGLSFLATYVDHLRAKGDAPVFVLDSGDQFQGTLLSNYDEGKAVFEAFNAIGYDAAVPGNHDYDFGPVNWLEDRVVPGVTSDNPREVLQGLSGLAKFPLLSANTYYKKSIRSNTPTPLTLNSSCEPVDQSLRDALDFSEAKRPGFLKPYVIVEKNGVRVALVGLDNKFTATSTTIENITDLCFRDEAETYLEIRRELEGRADVFVILMHNGNSSNSKDATAITTKINAAIPNGVDLVAAGHTHSIHDHTVDGVHIVQDGSGAKSFGRVDLFYNHDSRKVLKDQTKSWAAQDLDPEQCKVETRSRNQFVCDQYPLPLAKHPQVESVIARVRKEIAPLATKRVLNASEAIKRDRIAESALANLLTDGLRGATGADIALMNTGGIRADLPAGEIDYETFFEVLPFNNKVAVIHQLPWSLIKTLLHKTAVTCGRYGGLMFSGLRVQYSRVCPAEADLAPDSKVIRVETLSGEVLLDAAQGIEAPATRAFKVATLDFIAAGGSGYEDFRGTKVDEFAGIARDLIAGQLGKSGAAYGNAIDGRFKNIAPSTPGAERASWQSQKSKRLED